MVLRARHVSTVLILAGASLSSASLWSSVAAADTAARKQATTLFEDGRRLLAVGRFDEACSRFTESQKLDPSAGTLLNLVDCYERQGLLATALRACGEADKLATSRGDVDSELFAKRRAQQIEARVPSIRIEVRQNKARNRKITQVSVDGTVVEWTGKALLVDPGRRHVAVTFAGEPTASVDIEIAADGRQNVVVLPAEGEPASSAPAPSPDDRLGSRAPEPSAPWPRTGAIALLSTGGAAIAMGTLTGLLAIAAKDRLIATCSTGAGAYPDRCGGGALDDHAAATARSDLDAARTESTLSTVGFVAGAVLVAAGAVLYLTTSRSLRDVGAQSPCPMGMSCFFSSARKW
jgi:hypothetical protein